MLQYITHYIFYYDGEWTISIMLDIFSIMYRKYSVNCKKRNGKRSHGLYLEKNVTERKSIHKLLNEQLYIKKLKYSKDNSLTKI